MNQLSFILLSFKTFLLDLHLPAFDPVLLDSLAPIAGYFVPPTAAGLLSVPGCDRSGHATDNMNHFSCKCSGTYGTV
jgi:hypothetical protein